MSFLETVMVMFGAIITALLLVALLIYLIYPAISYDLQLFSKLIGMQLSFQYDVFRGRTYIDLFEGYVVTQPYKNFVLYEDDKFTYADVNKVANKLANYFLTSGEVKMRDVVCLFMFNEPAFVWSFLGIAKVGATTALINHHLRGKSLVHCLKLSGAKKIICGKDDVLVSAVKEILPELEQMGMRVYVDGSGHDVLPALMSYLDDHVSSASTTNPPFSSRKGLRYNTDSCVYIYTSGTTGLPKATKMTHKRMYLSAHIAYVFGLCKYDVFYICLPLYHSAAFNIALANVISQGATCAIRKKFSVREFWDDVRKYKATVIHYIGETARYLVQSPRQESDGRYKHRKIKLAIGNGLTKDIWQEFKSRFNIQHIGEFYGASEGNFMVFNLEGKVGACGRYTPLQHRLLKVLEIIDCEVTTAEAKRDQNGRCILMPRGQQGLLLTKISRTLPLDGYLGDKALTEKKIIRDVKRKGDQYFNTGDLMMIDKQGFIYFKDRLGNTFRWKGENVATTEVELVLMDLKAISAASVFGVTVEGQSGRAGMASIVLRDRNQNFNGPELYKHVTEYLPGYACPKFVRLKGEIEVTGTFKQYKVNMMKEGFDPSVVMEPLYYMDDKKRSFEPINEEVYNSIINGKIKL